MDLNRTPEEYAADDNEEPIEDVIDLNLDPREDGIDLNLNPQQDIEDAIDLNLYPREDDGIDLNLNPQQDIEDAIDLNLDPREDDGIDLNLNPQQDAREDGIYLKIEAPVEANDDAAQDARNLQAQALSWDDLSYTIDQLILSYTPSYFERCRWRTVCHRWCDATRHNLLAPPPPPLPMVIKADFTLLNCFADGPKSASRAIKLPAGLMNGRHTACVGSLDGWIICAYPRSWDPSQSLLQSDECCFVLDPSKQKFIKLPDPPAFGPALGLHGSVQVTNANGAMRYMVPETAIEMTLEKVVLTVSPDQSDCNVAALSRQRGRNHLALCTTAMPYWFLYKADFISVGIDLEFYKGLLYLVDENIELYVMDFGPECRYFPVASHVERCLVDKPPSMVDKPLGTNDTVSHSCSLVQSKTNLLLIVRKFVEMDDLTGVSVYLLENNSKPWKWKEITTLKGNSILISSSSNKVFPAAEYTEIEDNTIYFLDCGTPGFLSTVTEDFSYRMLVYNMKDKTINVRQIGTKFVHDPAKFPMWFCPME